MVFRIAHVTAHTKFTLTEDRIPTHWVNLLPDLPGEPLPPLNPGTMQPAGPDDLTPIFPMEIIGQEVSGDSEVEIPEPVRDVYRLWRPTPLFRAHRLERELDTPGAHLLQVRGRLPGRLAQAEQRRRAGLREQGGRGEPALDRDRRGPVGLGPGARVQPVRPRVRRLHGRRELRPEALPARDDGELGRHRDPLAERHDRGGPEPGRRTRPAHSGSRSPRPSRSRRATRAPTTRSARCSTTCASTRPSSARRRSSRCEMAGDEPDVVVGCVGGGSNFAGTQLPVRAARAARRGEDALPRGRAGRLPDADARRLPLRLRRHGRAHAAHAHVHARARLRAAARARGRPALPRRLADAVRARQGGPRRGARLQAERDVRGGAPLRADRGRSSPAPSPRTRSAP